MGIGIALLWLLDGGWVAYALMASLGLTMGMSGADGLLAGGVASVLVAALLALRVPGAGPRS